VFCFVRFLSDKRKPAFLLSLDSGVLNSINYDLDAVAINKWLLFKIMNVCVLHHSFWHKPSFHKVLCALNSILIRQLRESDNVGLVCVCVFVCICEITVCTAMTTLLTSYLARFSRSF